MHSVSEERLHCTHQSRHSMAITRREGLVALAQCVAAIGGLVGFDELISQSRNHISILSDQQRERLAEVLTAPSAWRRLECHPRYVESFSTSLPGGEELTVTGTETDHGLLLEATLEGGDTPFVFKCMFHNSDPRDRKVIYDLIVSGRNFEYSVPTPELSSL